MIPNQFVDIAALSGAVTRYYNAAATREDCGAGLLIVLAACMGAVTIALIMKWRREGKR